MQDYHNRFGYRQERVPGPRHRRDREGRRPGAEVLRSAGAERGPKRELGKADRKLGEVVVLDGCAASMRGPETKCRSTVGTYRAKFTPIGWEVWVRSDELFDLRNAT
jgi:hypothetical protein